MDSSGADLEGGRADGTSPPALPERNAVNGTTTTSSSQPYNLVQVVVNRDDRGYGMKVSGDNPVYVQSVKEGGAAERAGLHAGDKIIKVNGTNVKSSTHVQVVTLIRAQTQVVLTVQQRTSRHSQQGSPSMLNQHRQSTASTTSSNSPSATSQRITGPQPVDNEKQFQLQREKEQYYRLMIEKEKHWMDVLRSQIASAADDKKLQELEKTKKNIETLEAYLHRSVSEQHSPPSPRPHHIPLYPSPSPSPAAVSSPASPWSPTSPQLPSTPPPLPRRNQSTTPLQQKQHSQHNQKHRHRPHFNTIPTSSATTSSSGGRKLTGGFSSTPCSPVNDNEAPPIPPRNNNNTTTNTSMDAVNSINKQMSYPLVATFATLVSDDASLPSNNTSHHHQRTKSSPESLSSALTVGAEASRRLIASESLSDLSRDNNNWERAATPPGTPPPPYPSPLAGRRADDLFTFPHTDVDSGPRNVSGRILANNSPIHAANSQVAQQPIISMEDDEISDLEINQVEDHGHFKSLSRLWEHLPHLSVFMNYILSNSDPNSLLFYLLTDLYKEGNAKEMRKWAFEIHSCFLVPGAPLRLGNVDENIAREIDIVLTKEYNKEEILRKIFWKARSRAKEELTRQLADFQQKRIAGLGTLFGPGDQQLLEVYNDKSKEIKLYESLFLEKLDPYLEEVEKEPYEPRRYYTAAALITVLTRVFQIRPIPHAFEKCPTFVSREKAFKFQFLGRYTRKLNLLNHQFLAQNYYIVMMCYHCHQIIYGIGPQGYQCTVCHIDLHRHCVKLHDDACPGPVTKKDKFKFMRMRQEQPDQRRKQQQTHNFLQTERQIEEVQQNDTHFECGDSTKSSGQPVSRSGSDRRSDAGRDDRHLLEAAAAVGGGAGGGATAVDPMNDSLIGDTLPPECGERLAPTKRKSTNVNRSESVKEQPEKRKQQRRNISDPSHNNTVSADADLDTPHSGLSNPDSSSSSNCSLSNGRLTDSPSNSVDTVQGRHHHLHHANQKTDSDSESGFESDIPVWQNFITEDERNNLSSQEQKRQEIINELFSTENSHVRSLRVLYKIFYERIRHSQMLKLEELALIFPNIKDLFDVHNEFNKRMKKRRNEQPLIKDVGDLLLHMFESDYGENLKLAAAKFCEKQNIALHFIQDRRKKDSKFNDLLSECEKKRHCRRLPFQGILPTEMQRLSKYPLLLERLLNNVEATKGSNSEATKIKRALHISRDILNYVDESVRDASNRHRLEEIKKHLDTTNFKGEHPIMRDSSQITDLTSHKLIREGPMYLKRNPKAPVPVHVLLMEEAVYILQREGDRFLLKFFHIGPTPNSLPLSPYIKTSFLLVRPNAVIKNGLYLVNLHQNNSQIYELEAEDVNQRDTWFRHFEKAVETHHKKDGKFKNAPTTDLSAEEVVHDLQQNDVRQERAEQTEQQQSPSKDNNTQDKTDDSDSSKTDLQDSSTTTVQAANEDGSTINNNNNKSTDDGEDSEVVSSTPSGGLLRTTTSKISAEEWPLIQPSQVQVEVPPVHTAESMLTPLEQIHRKDRIVMEALQAKQTLIADLMNIPREHFAHIADVSASTEPREPSERVTAAIYQMNQLLQLLNDSLSITEGEAIAARGGKIVCASHDPTTNENTSSTATNSINNSTVAHVPVHAVQQLVQPLSRQLNALLDDVRQMEEERVHLRKETNRMREQLHEQYNLHGKVPVVEDDTSNDTKTTTDIQPANAEDVNVDKVEDCPSSEQ